MTEQKVTEKIFVLDPGENTGWVCQTTYEDGNKKLTGGTSVRSHIELFQMLVDAAPTVIVFERFNLYPGMAQTMSWNSFYPCEAIGVIKLYSQLYEVEIVAQAPSIKKYSGGLDDRWIALRKSCEVTEHTKDAYLHLKYFLRNR